MYNKCKELKGGFMIIKYKEDSNINESVLDITAVPNDEMVQRIISLANTSNTLFLKLREKIFVINISDIHYAQSIDDMVYVFLGNERYECALKLYKLEEIFSSNFVRISKSTIVNVLKVKAIEPTFNSKLILYLENNSKVEVNRSYIKQFKKEIGMR